MTFIQTFTGLKYHPLDPKPEEVCFFDIAHALALKCRFGGHCLDFYSVAQHSVLIADYMKRDGYGAIICLLALLHDAAEAYLPDVASPIKAHLPGFKELENKNTAAIMKKYKLLDEYNEYKPLIKEYDIRMLETERRDLMVNSTWEWTHNKKAEAFDGLIVPWTCAESHERWLGLFVMITGMDTNA